MLGIARFKAIFSLSNSLPYPVGAVSVLEPSTKSVIAENPEPKHPHEEESEQDVKGKPHAVGSRHYPMDIAHFIAGASAAQPFIVLGIVAKSSRETNRRTIKSPLIGRVFVFLRLAHRRFRGLLVD